jgi:predicted tellurium resistance membrane protein TerC
MDVLFTSEGLVALLTLTVLEIVLGIDNLIFIGILASKLPENQQGTARSVGLSLALGLRVAFLFAATWIAGLTHPWFSIPAVLAMDAAFDVTGRDVIMLGGGLFLLYKATTELHDKLEGGYDSISEPAKATMLAVIANIIMLDVVFSIDSVITAIGLSNELVIMVIAVVISIIVMQLTAKSVTRFIQNHPTIKILALSFLLMVGLVLTAEGFHAHVPKGYVYFAMAFSIAVEAMNMRYRRRSNRNPIELHQR